MEEKYKIISILLIILIGIALTSSEGIWSFLAGIGTALGINIIMDLGAIGGYFSSDYKSYVIGLVIGTVCMGISLVDKLIKEEMK